MELKVFVSHASEDKETIVRPLVKKLSYEGIPVWYDEFEIKPGESIAGKVAEGLATSNYGILVLSKHFFEKKWTKTELNTLINKTINDTCYIIPIWVDLSRDYLEKINPILSDMKGIVYNNEKDLPRVVEEIKSIINPKVPILLEVKNALDKIGIITPELFDDWWLYLLEGMHFDSNIELEPYYFLNSPLDNELNGKTNNIFWSIVKRELRKECYIANLSQFSSVEEIMKFYKSKEWIKRIFDANVKQVILCFPQLLLFDNEFFKKHNIDRIIESDNNSIILAGNTSVTIDGKIPTTNILYALKFIDTSNYKPSFLLKHFIKGEPLGPMPGRYDYLVMLVLLNSTNCLYPEKVKSKLLQGFYSENSINELLKAFKSEYSKNEIYSFFSNIDSINKFVSEVNDDFKFGFDSNEIAKISRKIFDLQLEKNHYSEFDRLTISNSDLRHGFRGLTFQPCYEN